MDIFQTTVTSCTLIYNFLDARSSYPAQSKSLAARFRWDSRVLQQIIDFFTARMLDGKLSNDDAVLLEETTQYLSSLAERLNGVQLKLTANDRWTKEVKKAMWMFYKNDVLELERELFEWTQRLDLRLLALPEKLRQGIIPAGDTEEQMSNYTPGLAAQRRIEKFLSKSQAVKRQEWEDLWIKDFHSRVTFCSHSPATFMAADFSSHHVIIENKPYPAHILDSPTAFQSLRQEIGEFAAALRSLDPTTVGLLKCIALAHDIEAHNFALIHEIPFPLDKNPPSLKKLISEKDAQNRRLLPAHPLNERFELARKLAAAVLFLHSIGWVHKRIRSRNILVIEKTLSSSSSRKPFPRSLGNPYLVNFESSRSNGGETDPAVRGGIGWDEEIYHHPDRQSLQGNAEGARYSMLHDIYSLGVVLLELGIWRPLEKYAANLKDNSPWGRRDFLVELAEETNISMGRRYKELVIWCLKLEGDSPVANVRYAMNVLETLENLAAALA